MFLTGCLKSLVLRTRLRPENICQTETINFVLLWELSGLLCPNTFIESVLALILYGCHSKWTQIQWLKTTPIYLRDQKLGLAQLVALGFMRLKSRRWWVGSGKKRLPSSFTCWRNLVLSHSGTGVSLLATCTSKGVLLLPFPKWCP
jgi:hypothetical protein